MNSSITSRALIFVRPPPLVLAPVQPQQHGRILRHRQHQFPEISQPVPPEQSICRLTSADCLTFPVDVAKWLCQNSATRSCSGRGVSSIRINHHRCASFHVVDRRHAPAQPRQAVADTAASSAGSYPISRSTASRPHSPETSARLRTHPHRRPPQQMTKPPMVKRLPLPRHQRGQRVFGWSNRCTHRQNPVSPPNGWGQVFHQWTERNQSISFDFCAYRNPRAV